MLEFVLGLVCSSAQEVRAAEVAKYKKIIGLRARCLHCVPSVVSEISSQEGRLHLAVPCLSLAHFTYFFAAMRIEDINVNLFSKVDGRVC